MNIEDFIYRSFGNARPYFTQQTDEHTRHPRFAKAILEQLGLLKKRVPTILVTGSKGKGSVSRMIAFLLERAGYRVGHFSSPHLLEFNERIRINGKAITDEDMVRLAKKIMPIVKRMEVQEHKGEYISPIALSQSMAILYFDEQQVDVAVIEAGRGGRFDDTNQIPHQVAVVTAILEEHLGQLGPTLQEVIWHKLGIITDEVERVYIGKQRDDVIPMVQQQLNARHNTVQVYHYNTDFAAHDVTLSLAGTAATITSHGQQSGHIVIPLLGAFQADNYALAYTVANDWSHGAVAQGDWQQYLSQLRWPGRGEIIGRQPLVLLDGGVHHTSATQVRDLVAQIPYSRLHVVLSIPKDKDVNGVIRVWSSLADAIYTTTTTNTYLCYDVDYSAILQQWTSNGAHVASVVDAIAAAKEGLDEQGIMLLMGTQSFLGDVKRLWGESIRDL